MAQGVYFSKYSKDLSACSYAPFMSLCLYLRCGTGEPKAKSLPLLGHKRYSTSARSHIVTHEGHPPKVPEGEGGVRRMTVVLIIDAFSTIYPRFLFFPVFLYNDTVCTSTSQSEGVTRAPCAVPLHTHSGHFPWRRERRRPFHFSTLRVGCARVLREGRRLERVLHQKLSNQEEQPV